MSKPTLDLTDIQGNILLGYGIPFGCYMFFEVTDSLLARKTLVELIPEVTTSGWWRDGKPQQTFNIAFTHPGLKKLQLPTESLAGFPVDFQEGMLARSVSLNNVRKNAPEHWEKFWREGNVHVWISVNAISKPARDQHVEHIQSLIKKNGGLQLLDTQDAGSLEIDGKLSHKEHFGYTDAFGNPDIEGSGIPPRPGRGTPAPSGKWEPLKTGEFLLGHVDESGEVPDAPEPNILSLNGSYLVYMKLHQNVGAFRKFIEEQGAKYPGGTELLKAKLVGRWDDGTPLALSPYQKDPGLVADPMRNNDFGYDDDQDGVRVPLGAHIRRMNPRDTFGFGGRLASRHRIARRGLPFGDWVPYKDDDGKNVEVDDSIERGVNFMVVNASISRQFEFVWKQWVNYGNDFSQGNDRDPLIGNHDKKSGMVIPGDPDRIHEQPTHIIPDIPQFVELRGGGYFFLPSLTALRLIAEGTVIENLDTYDPAMVPHEYAVRVPGQPQLPISHPLPPDDVINRSFFKWLASLPGVIVSPLKKRMKSWAADNPLTVMWLLRTFKPVLILKKKNLAIIFRYQDVVTVLNEKDSFYVKYGRKMGKLTNGGEFFLGMQPGEKYDQDVQNMRAATRPDDISRILLPTVTANAKQFVEQSGGRLDVVNQLGLLIPTFLTQDYMGIPVGNVTEFAARASLMFRYLFIPDNPSDVDDDALAAGAITRKLIDDEIQRRKKENDRKDDMLGRCLKMQADGVPRMDDVQIRDNLLGLFVGMIPSTSKCCSQVLDQLLDRPEVLYEAQKAARADNDGLLEKYVFEALRFNPNNPGVSRIVAREYKLGGKRLPAGMKVLALTWSAMFDNRQVNWPNRFLVDRPANNYLHFGLGMHECWGKRISLMQIPRILKPVLQQNNLRRAEGDPGKLQMAGPFPSSLVVEFDPKPTDQKA